MIKFLMSNATDSALGIVCHHFLGIGDTIRDSSPRLKCFLDPAPEFGGIPWILIISNITNLVVPPAVLIESRREIGSIWAGRKLYCNYAVWQFIAALLKRCLYLPVNKTAAVGAASNQNNCH